MSRTDPQVNVRIPADLLAILKARAAASRRSMAAELAAILEREFSRPA